MLTATLFAGDPLLKFVWARRLFGSASMTMGAGPNEVCAAAHARADPPMTAARSNESGMRSVYDGLASLAGPWALAAATLVVTAVMLRREFASASRRALLSHPQAERAMPPARCAWHCGCGESGHRQDACPRTSGSRSRPPRTAPRPRFPGG